MSVRYALRPEGKFPETLRPNDICLNTLPLKDMRYIQKANALTLLVQEADAVALVIQTTIALTTYVNKIHAVFRRETS